MAWRGVLGAGGDQVIICSREFLLWTSHFCSPHIPSLTQRSQLHTTCVPERIGLKRPDLPGRARLLKDMGGYLVEDFVLAFSLYFSPFNAGMMSCVVCMRICV